MIKYIVMVVQWPFRVVATMIYDHEWRGAEVRRNFGVLTLSFQTVRRKLLRPLSSVGMKGAESGGKDRRLRQSFHRDDSGQVYSTGNSGHRDIRLSAKLEAGI